MATTVGVATAGGKAPGAVVLHIGQPGQLHHVFGHGEGTIYPASVAEVASEPFVVMGKIMDAIRHHTVAHHVGMIHAGTGFLLPRGIVVPLEAGENVAGHVPHVGDAGRGLTALADRWQGPLGIFVVP